MNWYKVTLNHDQLARGVQLQFMSELMPRYAASGGKFLLVEWTGGPLTASTMYLTPLAAQYCSDILQKYGAVACDQPERDKLSMLMGPATELDSWFQRPAEDPT